jgi:hypothetical protein
MSAWSNGISTGPLLTDSDGALVSVSIHVDPRELEHPLGILVSRTFVPKT